MSNLKEKVLFSERLKKALNNANHPISPTYLSNEFNNRFDGQPISVQSANNWLLGKAIPSQNKLSLLAIWLNVSAQWLRFGEDEDEDEDDMNNILDIDLINVINKYKLLEQSQKNIVKQLIDEFTKN